ncbi:MAG: hypothetical protein K6348_02880 [Deferribacterales bacterium]
MKKLIFSLFIFLVLMGYGYTYDGGFGEYLKKEVSDFTEFKNQNDKEFYEYLKTSWKEFKSFLPLQRDKTPKIKKPPVIKDKRINLEKKEEKKVSDVGYINQVDVTNKDKMPETFNMVVDEQKVDFYGIDINLRNINYGRLISEPITGDKIAEAWKILATYKDDSLVRQLRENGSQKRLSDWSYFKLVKLVADTLYPNNYNDRMILSWFLLSRLGFEVKVGYNSENIFLLVPSKQIIYGVQFFNFNNVRYYVIWSQNRNIKNLYSYTLKHAESEKIFLFDIKDRINSRYVQKELSFYYDGKKYSFPVEYDIVTVDFYKDFPQTDLSVYYNADISGRIIETVMEHLGKIIEGKDELDSVNMILRFVQTAFAYKTDQEQFGYEKYFLPDETIHYPYSDCEDRSILFAYLVRKLLGLKVILLEYPGHVATAVRFNNNVVGDKVIFNGEVYTVADPTYINANVGMTMPQFKNVRPKGIF